VTANEARCARRDYGARTARHQMRQAAARAFRGGLDMQRPYFPLRLILGSWLPASVQAPEGHPSGDARMSGSAVVGCMSVSVSRPNNRVWTPRPLKLIVMRHVEMRCHD